MLFQQCFFIICQCLCIKHPVYLLLDDKQLVKYAWLTFFYEYLKIFIWRSLYDWISSTNSVRGKNTLLNIYSFDDLSTSLWIFFFAFFFLFFPSLLVVRSFLHSNGVLPILRQYFTPGKEGLDLGEIMNQRLKKRKHLTQGVSQDLEKVKLSWCKNCCASTIIESDVFKLVPGYCRYFSVVFLALFSCTALATGPWNI